MDVIVSEASFDYKPVLHHLMQLYLHDSSEFTGDDTGQDGLFAYRYFDEYWQESERFPFLIYCDAKLAGFVLINSHTFVLKEGAGRSIAEFFVMRKYRRRGVGREAAFRIFDRFPGRWEVRENAANVVGHQFWSSIIAEYTKGDYAETILDAPLWARGPVQTFDNSDGI